MPTYDYVCDACQHAFENWQSMTSRILRTCPECKKRKLRRLIGSGAGVIFKGSGFYETDYKRKSGPPKTESGKAEPGKADSGKTGTEEKASEKSDASSGESKGNSKSEPKSTTKSDKSGSSSKGAKKNAD